MLLTFCLLLLPLWESVIVLCFVVCYFMSILYSIVIILMWKRDLVALLNLSSWCLVMVERLFLAVPWGCLRFVIVVFPNHTHLLFGIVVIKPINIILSNCIIIIEPVHEIFNNVVCATSRASDQPEHTRSLIRAFASRLNILRLLSY